MGETNFMAPWRIEERDAFIAAKHEYISALADGATEEDAIQRADAVFFRESLSLQSFVAPIHRGGPIRSSFYADLADRRGDDAALQEIVHETVRKLQYSATSTNHPGVLLGKIQSGKTRAFLGVIAAAFDEGYDGAIVLTKGTKSLALQTLRRIEADFGPNRDRDEVQMFDILNMPPRLSPYELHQRLIIVAKKEDDNLRRLLILFDETYVGLRDKRWLIIDDEADFASLAFRKKDGAVELGTINRQIDDIRSRLANSQYLEVTATPYSLYLQPEEGVITNGIPILKPRKPRFTIVLPTHQHYVGGDYYFEQSSDESSPAAFFYEEVTLDERDALKAEDRRRFCIEDVLVTPKIRVLRRAIMNFAVGASIRRLQQRAGNEPLEKYSFVVHTEQKRDAHQWQLRVVDALWQGLQDQAQSAGPHLAALIRESYHDLAPSIALSEANLIPPLPDVEVAVTEAIRSGHLVSEKVNSENQIEALLDDAGQLRLRTPLNLFIGGQILDRGITIRNLIGFYYGRNPQTSQQDTVLQHSRMYGARSRGDLGVTRLYAPWVVYNRMRHIHQLDAALRNAFLSGANDAGVYFVETDKAGVIVPCAPNKLLMSDVYALRPGYRLLPVKFNTVSLVRGSGRLQRLDDLVMKFSPPPHEQPVLVPLAAAVEMLRLAFLNLVFEDSENGESVLRAMTAGLEWLVKVAPTHLHADSVWLVAAENRNVARLREGGRFSNAPDTKQQRELAEQISGDIPVLSMLRQNGTEADDWRGLPFWWPVVLVNRTATTAVYAVN